VSTQRAGRAPAALSRCCKPRRTAGARPRDDDGRPRVDALHHIVRRHVEQPARRPTGNTTLQQTLSLGPAAAFSSARLPEGARMPVGADASRAESPPRPGVVSPTEPPPLTSRLHRHLAGGCCCNRLARTCPNASLTSCRAAAH